MAPDPALSVLIPTLARPGLLRRTLQSLSAQTPPRGGCEVVVAIDGPDVATSVLVRRLRLRYPLGIVERAENGGRAAACNSALAAARGSLVLFLDDDVTLQPNVLVAHVSAHRGADELAYMGPAYPHPPSRSNLVGRWTEKRYEAFLQRLLEEGRVRSPRDATSVNLSVSAELARAAGGFWEGFSRYGKEDVEFVYRLSKLGVELKLLPEAVVYHWFDKSLATLIRQREDVAQNDLQLRELHPELAEYLECDRVVPGWSRPKRLAFAGLSRMLGDSDRLLDLSASMMESSVTPGSPVGNTVVSLAREFGYYRGLHRR